MTDPARSADFAVEGVQVERNASALHIVRDWRRASGFFSLLWVTVWVVRRTGGTRTIIKAVGDVAILPKHRLSCHCGAVVLELDLPDGIVEPRRCDCSICRRKGAIVGSVPLSGLRIIQGEDVLRLYQFNTRAAKHYFCSICGIYTHHQRRSSPDHYGYNVGCLEGVNPYLLPPVPVSDGVNHPADRKV